MSAALVLQGMLLSSAKPTPKRGKSSAGRAKPAKRRAASKPAPERRPVPGTFVDGRYSNPHGGVAYKLYTPRGSARRRLPLVVMLHGCTQSAADFAAGAGMNRLADELGFLVLYPEQSASANLGRCWNWHRPGDQERGRGEPAVIAGLTRHVIALCKANPARVYIAGISAGGAAAAIIAAAYPEIYVAVGVHSGLARGDVSTLGGAISAMRKGGATSAVSKTRPPLPTIVFHGDQDSVVHPSNAAGFVSHLRRSSSLPLNSHETRGRSRKGRDYTRKEYRRGAGPVLLEDWTVHGSGHGWSGGDAAGSYTDPAGPDASREMMRFFLSRRRPVARRKTG
ncbi:PHB depolymerase family esterase [Phenylobacterium sp. LjRoot225]|uniref:extracellular catalytic domain type 1 short-chain-length polyhydroxyalkanoate depolymerase n=1 Tax=Phenylobacterium sp. LjRoot225 TaxID=3342285 RepID=UPI003ED0F3B3